MQVTVTTPERQLLKDIPVKSIRIVTENKGQLTILDQHADYVGTLGTGVVSIEGTEEKTDYLGVISSGFIKIMDNHVSILANTLELASEIDLTRVEKSKEKAEEMLARITNPADFEKYNKKLSKALARIELNSISR